MDTNLNDYLKDIMPTTQTVTAMDFGPFASDYSSGCKNDETKPDRRGWKRRMVLEALKGMEITSARKMQKVLEERGIKVSVMTVANAIQAFKGDTNKQTSYISCTKSNVHSNYNYRDNNIVRSHNQTVQDDILKLLVSGMTGKSIAHSLGISWETVQRYIKKAKDSGLIHNEGTRKNPKWVLTSEQTSYMSCSKTTEIKEKPLKI